VHSVPIPDGSVDLIHSNATWEHILTLPKRIDRWRGFSSRAASRILKSICSRRSPVDTICPGLCPARLS
jgi:hypothetical protein